MSRDAVVFGIAGTCFGLLVGWIIGSQQAGGRRMRGAPAAAQSAPATSGNQPAAPPLDLQRISALEQAAKAQPSNALPRTELGNLYSDSDRPDLAIQWYEASLKINPKDVNVSTDLAVAYYYTGDADRALQQIETSLAIDPRHLKTLLNQGIIRAFGKQDLAGAEASWRKVVQIGPNTPEAARAQQGLDGLQTGHG